MARPMISGLVVLLLLAAGCDNVATKNKQQATPIDAVPEIAQETSPAETNGKTTIISNEAITVENGKVTMGPPKLTEAVEREIYKTLNQKKKIIEGIQNNGGPSRGVQQMQQEMELMTKGFMVRYNITREEIDAILSKGNSSGWN
ncbi:hypothetical protein [Stieleria varia]|uniref:Lipoprotein n=1 Tax=Stieleria varia TaxID=2528005 RepID=A0A5C6A4Y4_9BACT|nr:hypothetical protein [Stieleria varia]TWT94437.1 hypothetical protein Pla52n_52580 [Stieleria varia]